MAATQAATPEEICVESTESLGGDPIENLQMLDIESDFIDLTPTDKQGPISPWFSAVATSFGIPTDMTTLNSALEKVGLNSAYEKVRDVATSVPLRRVRSIASSVRKMTVSTVQNIVSTIDEFDKNYQNEIRPQFSKPAYDFQGEPRERDYYETVPAVDADGLLAAELMENENYDDSKLRINFNDVKKSAVDTTENILQNIDKTFDVAANAVMSGFRVLESTYSHTSDIVHTSTILTQSKQLGSRVLSMFETPITESFETHFEKNTGLDHLKEIALLAADARARNTDGKRDDVVSQALSVENLSLLAQEVTTSVFWDGKTVEVSEVLDRLRVESAPAVLSIKTFIRVSRPPSSSIESHATSVIAAVAEQACKVLLEVSQHAMYLVLNGNGEETMDARLAAVDIGKVCAWWCAELRFVAERSDNLISICKDAEIAAIQIHVAAKFAEDVLQLLQNERMVEMENN